jgi:hypothetical protein
MKMGSWEYPTAHYDGDENRGMDPSVMPAKRKPDEKTGEVPAAPQPDNAKAATEPEASG